MDLIDHPDNPVPHGAKAGFATTPDGVRIRYAHWAGTGEHRRGTVTLLQGRAEFIEKYFEVVEDLRKRGFDVVAFDWRGQGGSQRVTRSARRGHISNFRKFRTDLRTILKEVSLAHYAGPHFALAHSTGGLVLLSDTARLRTMLDRAVITSPLLGLPSGSHALGIGESYRRFIRIVTLGLLGKPPLRASAPKTSAIVEKVGYPLARLMSIIGLGRLYVPGGNSKLMVPFDKNRQTSDRTRFERCRKVLDKAPELGIGSATFGWLNAAARTMMPLRKRTAGPGIKLPCLMLGAGEDRIVSTPIIEDFVARTRSAAYVEIPGAAHEIMMERDVYRDQFWAAFDAFIPGFEAEKELAEARLKSTATVVRDANKPGLAEVSQA